MADRKWNNQGGSNFDAFSGKYKKPKEQQNIPKFSDLDESNSTSFNYKIPPKPKPKLGNFGDEIWTYSPVDDSPTPYVPFIDLNPKDPRIPRIRDRTPIPSIPHTDPVTSSTDLFPFTVFDEYEIVVKFGLLVLRISSGQAYAARQGLNDPRYDFSLVIKSSNAISFGGNSASTINLISVSNSAQNPIYSLYNWLITKLNIATNNDATGSDPVLSSIDIVENVAQLPSTQFISNRFTCGLFYAEGIQPNQICLNAINKIFKFEPSVNTNPTWTVTYPGEILPLCLDINRLQVVSIKLIPSALNQVVRGSGFVFVIRIARDATIVQLAESLEVDIKITSPELLFSTQQLDPSLYAVTGINIVAIGQISVTIPSLAEYADITIRPLADPTKLNPVPLIIEIIGSNVPDPTPDYDINALFQQVNMIVNPDLVKPIVTLSTDRTSTYPQNIADGVFNVTVTSDRVSLTDLSVYIQFDGTAIYSDFTVNLNPVSSNQIIAVIPAGQTTYHMAIKPNLTPVFTANRTIIPTIQASSNYIIGAPQLIVLTVTPLPSQLLVLKVRPLIPNNTQYQPQYFSLYGSNTGRTTIEVTNSDSNPTPVGLTSLFEPQLFGNSYGVSDDGYVYPDKLLYAQVALSESAAIASNNSLRYLYFFFASWHSLFDNDPVISFPDTSYSTMSAQLLNDFLPPPTGFFDNYGHVLGEFDHPYQTNAATTLGWVEIKWINKYTRARYFGIPGYESILISACVQLDTQSNTVTFISPFTTDGLYLTTSSPNPNVLVGHRDVVVNT